MSPESVPPRLKVKLSSAVPPVRLGMPVNANPLSVPASVALMIHVLLVSGPVSVVNPSPSEISSSMLSKLPAIGSVVPLVDPASPSTEPAPLIVRSTLEL